MHEISALKSFVVVGHSHAGAIVRGAGLMDRPVRSVHLDKGQGRALSKVKGEHHLNDELRSKIEAARAELRNSVVVSCVGGNVHNVMALLRSERDFDFVLSERAELPLDEDAEILPEDAVLESIRWRARGHVALLRCLANEMGAGMVHVESPPAIGDDLHCLSTLNRAGVLAQSVAFTRGVAPRTLRYKMWRLHSRVFREVCLESNVRFVPAPPASMQEDGFLVPDLYGNATHANAKYGELVIRQLEAI